MKHDITLSNLLGKRQSRKNPLRNPLINQFRIVPKAQSLIVVRITHQSAALAAQFFPRAVRAATQPGPPALHYRPLNGNNLREMARRKMHHGEGIFLNPMGIPREKRFWQVLSWKLFHKNAYGDFLDDQPTTPVTIDWQPVKNHRGCP